MFIPPERNAFGALEKKAVLDVFKYYESQKSDPPYGGVFQTKFEESFAEKMGGGYALAVSTGSIACYLALKSLNLPKGSEVVVSPVSDTGSLFAIIEAGLVPVIADCADEYSYNTSVQKIIEAVSERTTAVFLVHAAGIPIQKEDILAIRRINGLKIIEDCSQSPFAVFCDNCTCNDSICVKQEYVGSIGDVAAFSTMYRKTLQTGGSGGVVYTRNREVYKRLVEESDRGRQKWNVDFSPRAIGDVKISALNYNTNEISSAIGLASLARIDDAINQRRDFARKLTTNLQSNKIIKRTHNIGNSSPFFLPVLLESNLIRQKKEFCEYLKKNGIDLLDTYHCFMYCWEFVKNHPEKIRVVGADNAAKSKENIFNLFFNENYGEYEAHEIGCIFIDAYKKFRE
jgi:perosamine synthetase